MSTNPRQSAPEVSCTVVCTRDSGLRGVDRRAFGSGLPEVSMTVTWTPAEWRRFVDRRGYSLDLYDPLVARCLDGAGVRWVIRCVLSVSGSERDAWVAGVSGWAAELYAA